MKIKVLSPRPPAPAPARPRPRPGGPGGSGGLSILANGKASAEELIERLDLPAHVVRKAVVSGPAPPQVLEEVRAEATRAVVAVGD